MSLEVSSLSDFSESLPRIPLSIIHRSRLHDQLNKPSPLTFVAAPHGYGKTTLLVAWLENLAAKSLHTSLHWWEGNRLKSSLALAQKCRSLREKLTQQPHRTVVVIDHFDQAPTGSDEELLSLLREFRSLRVVIALQNKQRVRHWHAFELDPQTITGADLRFRREETHELHTKLSDQVTPHVIDRAHDAVGGWPVLVKATAREAGDINAAESYIRHKLHLSGSHESLVDFISKTNFGIPLTARHAQFLTQREDVENAIVELRKLGIISSRESANIDAINDQEFAYIDVINRFAPDPLEKDPRRQLYELAHWCLSEEDYLSAFRYFTEIEEWAELESLLHTYWYEILKTPRALEAVEKIDSGLAKNFPILMTVKDFVAGPRSRSGRLPSGLEVTPGGDVQELFQTSFHAGYLRFNGDFSRSKQEFASVRQQLDDTSPRTKQDVGAIAVMRLQIALDDLFADNLQTATHEAIQAYRTAGEANLGVVRRNAAGVLALFALLGGNGPGVQTWTTREAETAQESVLLDDMTKTVGLVAQGLKHLGDLETTRAHQVFSELNDVTFMDEMWPFIAYAHAEHALLTGQFMQGLRDLEAATAAHPKTHNSESIAVTLLTSARANLLLALGEGPRAAAELENVRVTHPMTQAVRARSELLAGKYADVVTTARRRSGREQWHDRAGRELRLLEALAKFQQGETQEARQLLTHVLNDDGAGLLRAMALAPRGLLQQALTKLEMGNATQATLRRKNPTPIFGAEISTVSLTPREQTVLRLVGEGLTTREIAEKLFVSTNTVKSQSRSLYRKLDVNSRAEALARAVEYGLLS